ncbi:MAG: hypothetical protein U0790_14705 [Isosphaeraceae bacterium]
MNRNIMLRGIAVLATATVLIISGCSTDVSDGGLQETGKVATPEQVKVDQEKIMKGMQGMYKGAPGAPTPKTPK